MGGVETAPISIHGKSHSLSLTLPPLSLLVFKKEKSKQKEEIHKSRR
jgi:1,4-alpha-glucan branching enzyme